jgi:fatty-acyl-CoA synthase
VAFSYASGTSSTPLIGQTIDANLRDTAARFAGREAVVDVATGRRLSYAELDVAVEEVARGLLARGVKRGERVGVWAPNCLEWVLELGLPGFSDYDLSSLRTGIMAGRLAPSR